MNLKKILSISFLCIALLLTIIPGSSFAENNFNGFNTEEESLAQFDKTFLNEQGKASEAYSKLNESFGKVEERKSDDYPDYYGGAYTNKDGQLVIYVKGDINKYKNDFMNRAGIDDIIFKTCEYSFKELTRIMDDMNAYKLENKDNSTAKNFNSYALMDAENRVVVELDEYNDEQITTFRKQVIDSPAVEFKQANNKLIVEINVNPGSQISIYSGSSGSMGYRARKNGQNGLVTAAHLAWQDCYIYFNGVNIATCTTRQNSGSVDAAFCQITNSNYTPSNTINGTSNTLSTTISEPGVGTVINKVGASTGHTSGTIISTNATATTDMGVTLTNLTSANYSSAAGDSGCIVYSVVGSSRYTLGTHVGAAGSTRYYTKANKINSALGIYRY